MPYKLINFNIKHDIGHTDDEDEDGWDTEEEEEVNTNNSNLPTAAISDGQTQQGN